MLNIRCISPHILYISYKINNMKKLIITLILTVVLTGLRAQMLTVSYSSGFSCSADLFFAVRTEINGDVKYQLTVTKTALPGTEVTFDLSTDLTENYVSAIDINDPSRPMFGGAIGSAASAIIYYDATTPINQIQEHSSPCGVGNAFYTRDGEFHFDMAN
jgi:hypothetical protein